MSGIEILTTVDSFIGIAKELASLRGLFTPEYKKCAADIYKICKIVNNATENVARWLFRFSYFNFKEQDASAKFNDLIIDYRTVRAGGRDGSGGLILGCGVIGTVYRENIEGRLRGLFADQDKLRNSQSAFERLATCDEQVKKFVLNIISLLDDFVSGVEQAVDRGDLNEAERIRVEFKQKTKEITERLNKINNDLNELVLEFAKIAGNPVSLY